MGKDIKTAVREICNALPKVEERSSHGLPDFKVRGKSFANMAVNHHGDGRIALWVHAPPGAQSLYTSGEPEYYFVPPYVGPKGWLGVHLDKGNDWSAIAARVREAYVRVAPASLVRELGEPIDIEPPTETIDPEEFDPLSVPHAQKKLARLREFCAELPETSETTSFGTPAFKAGKKTFLSVYRYRSKGQRSRRLCMQCWVGPELQATLCDDPRFRVPSYIGHRGWIDLDVEERFDWEEVRHLVVGSYRHFALKRMLKTLDAVAA